MKCAKCGAENSPTSRFCGQCGAGLAPSEKAPARKAAVPGPSGRQEPPREFWAPDGRWHLKALAGIYIFLTLVYFVMNYFLTRIPPPYRMRDIPAEMTPWLKR